MLTVGAWSGGKESIRNPPERASAESDAIIVPEKSTKTRVTPVEPMEEGSQPRGSPRHETRPDTGSGRRAHVPDEDRRESEEGQGRTVYQPVDP